MARTVPAAYDPLDQVAMRSDAIVVDGSGTNTSLQTVAENIHHLYRGLGNTAAHRHLQSFGANSASFVQVGAFSFYNTHGVTTVDFHFEYTATTAAGGRTYEVQIELTGETTGTVSGTATGLTTATTRTKGSITGITLPNNTQHYWECIVYARYNGGSSGLLTYWGGELVDKLATTAVAAGSLAVNNTEGENFVGIDTAEVLDHKTPIDVYTMRRMHQNLMFIQKDYSNQFCGFSDYYGIQAREVNTTGAYYELEGGDCQPWHSRLAAIIPLISRRNTGVLFYRAIVSNPAYNYDAVAGSSQYNSAMDERSIWLQTSTEEVQIAGSVSSGSEIEHTGYMTFKPNGMDFLKIYCGKIGKSDADGGSFGGMKLHSFSCWEDAEP